MVITSSKEIPKEARVRHENFKVALTLNFPDQEVAIGGTLSAKGRMKLCSLLKKNLDIFAWQPSDMTGVPRSIAEHRLNIQAEVQKLVEAGIMREVYYHEWLSNPVMVKKHDGSWRMCVNFTDLNKACPQDCYPLPEIDWKVESLCGYLFNCFLDAYKGYHQIQMAESDEEKTAFHTSQGHTEAKMLRDIDETFRTLRKINMKLNPKKSEKSLPLFKTLKKCIKKSDFHWTPEAEQAFKQLKQHLSELPLLVAPKPKEELIVYLSATHGAISAVLMTERGTVQTPVYFRLRRTITKMKRHAGRTQYPLLARPRWKGTVPIAAFYYRKPDESPFRHINGSETPPQESGTLSRDGFIMCSTALLTTRQSFAHLAKVLVEILKEKSIHEKEVTAVVEEDGPTWMTPIIEYLKEGTLPDDKKDASKLRIKARHMHAGPRSVVAKAMRLGYYWSTMHRDARDMIRTCNDCQIHRPVPRNPQQPLTFITAPWPFYKCGIDIAGPFPDGPGKVKFFIVAMDYFTKWIEAKAVATITGNQVKKFVWDNIVCRFGLPGEIVSDNGKQFSDNPFKDWCEKLNITQRFASVKHPQSNGLMERANRSLGEGIKARLGEGNKNWIE
ncbi:reverse transcriptase domain-containing protein [Tanacetum coccineum]